MPSGFSITCCSVGRAPLLVGIGIPSTVTVGVVVLVAVFVPGGRVADGLVVTVDGFLPGVLGSMVDPLRRGFCASPLVIVLGGAVVGAVVVCDGSWGAKPCTGILVAPL